jgi:hypothetical protein
MRTYSTWLDPRATVTRQMMREQAPRDIASSTMRLALHLSDLEHHYLTEKNPESLGLPPGPDHDMAWAKFIAHPASAPYRVNKV